MPHVADLAITTTQVIGLRAVAQPVVESPSVKNVSATQHAAMVSNPIGWHWDPQDSTFKEGLLPDPNVNANPMGALDLAKYNAKLRVATFAKDCRNTLTGGADIIEIAGWSRYVQLAAKFDAGTLSTAETQALQTECTLRGRGETIAQLVAKVKSNDAKYTVAQAAVNGMTKQASDAINICTTATQVEAVLTALKSQAQGLMAQLIAGA